tara:strand:- start:608 stop:979 length:372 start_codon:yes stop_codon:yes gene_type:complete
MNTKQVLELNKLNQELNLNINFLKECIKNLPNSTKLNNTVEPGEHLNYPEAEKVDQKIESYTLDLCIKQTEAISAQLKTIFDISCTYKNQAERLNRDLKRFKFDIKVQESKNIVDGIKETYTY